MMNNNCNCNNCCQMSKMSPLEDVCDDVKNEYEDCNCKMKNSCKCGFDEEDSLFPMNPMLAQSYVPIQYMQKTFTPCCGLKNGTLFPELVSPYYPCQSVEDIEYLRRRNMIGKGCNSCGEYRL